MANNSTGTYRRPSSAYDAMDESTDGCSRILQVVLFAVAILAIIFCLAALGNCEFLWFYMPNLEISNVLDNNANNTTDSNSTTASSISYATTLLEPTGKTKLSFGLFKFQDPIRTNQCLIYDEQTHWSFVPETFPLQMKIARWGMSITAALTILALLLLFLEICCCRFICSRVLINLSFFVAMVSAPTTFLLYTQGES